MRRIRWRTGSTFGIYRCLESSYTILGNVYLLVWMVGIRLRRLFFALFCIRHVVGHFYLLWRIVLLSEQICDNLFRKS